jgi:drug/metabolite transporter (DMT)-like permease
MMRGAEMLFAALFAVTFLGRRLNRLHAAGLAACVVGISAVGAASLLSGEGSRTRVVPPAEMALGMALIILSQAVQAGQLTFEDHFMSGGAGLNLDPLLIVGWEGVLGTVAMAGLLLPLVAVLPGADGDGVHEDSRDTLHVSWCFLLFFVFAFSRGGTYSTASHFRSLFLPTPNNRWSPAPTPSPPPWPSR